MSSSATSNSSSNRFFTMFKYLDFFSEGINLNVAGHAVFRTVYGSLFTVVYLGIMIFIVVMNAKKYFDKSNPVAVSEVFSREIYPEINLFDNKIMPVMVAYSDETNWITVDQMAKYFTVVTRKIVWEAVADSTTKEVHLVKKFESYPTIPCNQLPEADRKLAFDYMGAQNYYYETLTTYGMCSQVPKNATVKGKVSDTYFSQLVVKVLPCSLATGCVAADLIPLVNFQFLLPFTNLKVSDEGDPHDFAVNADEVYYVNPSLRQIYTSKLKQLNIYDFEGLFPTWGLQKTVYDIDSKALTLTSRKTATSCTAAQVAIPDNQDCLPYFELVVQSSGVVSNNKRTYISLFDTLGAIGGTNGVVIVVMLMLYGPINEKKRKEYMTRKIYSLVGVKETDLEKGMDYINRKRQATHVQTGGTDDNLGSRAQTHIRIEREKRKWWTYICFCCRKKTTEEIEWEKKVARAHQKIVDSLDVLTIVRNFNELKVLTHFFFGERHFDMAQYVGFDLWQEECEKRERRNNVEKEDEAITNSQLAEERRNLRRARISKRIVTEKQRFNHWMEYMRDKHMKRTKDSSELTSELSNELDEFYYQKLFQFQNNQNLISLIYQVMKEEAPDTEVQDNDLGGHHQPNEHQRYLVELPLAIENPNPEAQHLNQERRHMTEAAHFQPGLSNGQENHDSSPTHLISGLAGQGNSGIDEKAEIGTVNRPL